MPGGASTRGGETRPRAVVSGGKDTDEADLSCAIVFHTRVKMWEPRLVTLSREGERGGDSLFFTSGRRSQESTNDGGQSRET